MHMNGLRSSTSSSSDLFDKYVNETMKSTNKQDCWHVMYMNYVIPVVAVMNNTPFMLQYQKIARKLGKEEFNCSQCAYNCDKLITIIGKEKNMLCASEKYATSYSIKLSNIASEVYQYAKDNIDSYTLTIASDTLLLKHKYKNSCFTRKSSGESTVYLHYAGNCDTIPSKYFHDNSSQLKKLNIALDYYRRPMYNLLVNLSKKWNLAGHRHALLQRINTMIEISKYVTYGEEYFGGTLSWIINVLRGFKHPLNSTFYDIKDIVNHVANAIASGNIVYSNNSETLVTHLQYTQMINTICMLMNKSISRNDLHTTMRNLCCPQKGMDIKHLESFEEYIGSNVWTRVASTKSLENYYSDYVNTKYIWMAPSALSKETAGSESINKECRSPHSNHGNLDDNNVECIPELIKLLVSGKDIYIDCNNTAHAILAHTSISPKYMVCAPIKEKGALMWSFLRAKGLGLHTKRDNKWQKLIAIHYLHAENYKNYILVCESSRRLISCIKNNPVLGEWTLSNNSKKEMTPILNKLQRDTLLTCNTYIGYSAINDYPIIGVGLCEGLDGKISHNNEVSYKINEDGEERKLKYFITREECEKILANRQTKSKVKYCSNCCAPRGNLYSTFCSNCGNSF